MRRLDAETDRADRLAAVGFGSRDSGDANADVRVELAANRACHRRGRLVRDHAVLVDHGRVDAVPDLGFGCVRDQPAAEVPARAGHVGDRARQQTARAGLHHRDRHATVLEQAADRFLEGVLVRSPDRVAEHRSDLLLDRSDAVAGDVLEHRLRGEAHVDAVCLVVDADGRILGVAQVTEQLVQHRFTQPGRLQRARDQHAAIGTRPEPRGDVVLPHAGHLGRRAGHRDNDRAVLLHPPARSGAAGIGNRLARGNDRRLLDVLLGHPPPAALEEVAQVSFQFRHDVGLFAHRFGDRVAGDIVLGRSQSTGENDHVGAAPGRLDQLDQTIPVVADLVHEVEVDAHRRQALSHVVGVRVEDFAHQDLGADADDLRPHVALVSLCFASLRWYSPLARRQLTDSARPADTLPQWRPLCCPRPCPTSRTWPPACARTWAA